MTDDAELQDLLRRPTVVAAVQELGLLSLGLEDVLGALRRFGEVRIDVRDDHARPYACVLQVAGAEPETGYGPTVFHAALVCWAAALDGLTEYAALGYDELEQFLLGQEDTA